MLGVGFGEVGVMCCGWRGRRVVCCSVLGVGEGLECGGVDQLLCFDVKNEE